MCECVESVGRNETVPGLSWFVCQSITLEVWVQPQASSCGICGRVPLGQVCVQVLSVSMQDKVTIKIDSTLERVEELKYLRTTVTNKYSVQEDIKNRLK